MRKITGSRPAKVQEKKAKKNAQGAWIIWRRKRERMEVGEEENQRKHSAQKGAMKSTFIHTVSSNYKCIYSIPSGVSIVFKNNRAHT